MEWEERLSDDESLLLLQPTSWMNVELVSPAGQKIKFRSRYVGCIAKRFILLQAPETQNSDKFLSYFQQGSPVTIRGIIEGNEGSVIGFISKFHKTAHIPEKMLVFHFPDTVQYLSLRKNARYNIDLPIKMSIEDETCAGKVLDVSTLGCQLAVSSKSDVTLEEGQSVTINTEQIADKSPQVFNGQIRSIRVKGKMVLLGIEFSEESQKAVTKSLSDMVLSNSNSNSNSNSKDSNAS